ELAAEPSVSGQPVGQGPSNLQSLAIFGFRIACAAGCAQHIGEVRMSAGQVAENVDAVRILSGQSKFDVQGVAESFLGVGDAARPRVNHAEILLRSGPAEANVGAVRLYCDEVVENGHRLAAQRLRFGQVADFLAYPTEVHQARAQLQGLLRV